MPRTLDAPVHGNTDHSPAKPSSAEPDPLPRPIRVLIVDTAIAFGGTLAVARNLLKHLDKTLIDASLVSACADGFVSSGFAGNAPVRLLAPRVDYVTLQTWKSAIGRRFRAAPLRRGVELMAMTTEIIANLPYLLRLIDLYRKMHVDVVHVNNYSMEPLWAARILGIPIVYHLHGHVPSAMDGSGRRNFRHVKAFVSISRSVTESALRAGIERARIHDIPNFVERIPDASPQPLPAEPTIGIFGRVTHWKGQKEFLKVALQLLQKFPQLKVYVVGDASDGDPKYFDECRRIAQSSPFAQRIEFTGRVSEVAAYYRKCTVVVHASISPEPFGMVLIEAMAEARPVVASTLGATSEIIADGVDGYLVNPKDTDAMAARIGTLLANPSLAAAMGLKGREKVLAHYNPTKSVRRFECLYTEISAPRV